MAADTTGAAARPRDDDVVISHPDDQWRFGLGSRPASLLAGTYENALAVLRPFAEIQRIDVWVTHDDGVTFELVIGGRPRPISVGR